MQIDLLQARERVTVLAPRGRLDAVSAQSFRERVRQLVDAGANELVVDMGQVSFVDSTGLAAVIGGLKAARQAGGDLRIARPNEQALTLLDLTSLDRVFRPFSSVEEALSGAGTTTEHTVECRASPEALGTVHEALQRFWQGIAVPDDQWRMMFEVAVSEIAANIVEHARPPLIRLVLRAERDRVVAEFTDTGQGWTGTPAPADVIDELAERGRGLALARMAVDDVVYERQDTRNHWRLVKHR